MVTSNPSKVMWKNRFLIAELPEPPETFTYSEIDELNRSKLYKFRTSNVIEIAEHRRAEGKPHTYRVNEQIYDEAVERVEENEALPCCNRSLGVVNEGGDLVCKRCESEVPRHIFERVMG